MAIPWQKDPSSPGDALPRLSQSRELPRRDQGVEESGDCLVFGDGKECSYSTKIATYSTVASAVSELYQ